MEENFELVEKFINISSSIESLYKRLYKLEMEGKKDTPLYKKTLEYLTVITEAEKEIYDKEIRDCSRCATIIGIVMKDKLEDRGIMDDTSCVVNHDYKDRVYKRVLNNLFNKMILNKESLQTLVNKLYEVGVDEQDNIREMYNKAAIHSYLEEDALRGYLSFLNDYIPDYKIYNADLIGSKYNISFINKSIEEDMIRNDFNISNDYFTTSKLISQINDVPSDEYDTLRNSYAVSLAIEESNRLLEIKDDDYYSGNNEMIFNSILIRCLIDSLLQLMDEEYVASLNYDFNEFIEGIQSHNYCSEAIIIKCFTEYKSNRERQKIVSLKK